MSPLTPTNLNPDNFHALLASANITCYTTWAMGQRDASSARKGAPIYQKL